jgi:cysteine-rich repeat protein
LPVDPNASYLLSFSYKSIAAPDRANLYPSFTWYDAEDEKVYSETILSPIADGWARKVQLITAPENAVRVKLQLQGRVITKARFDDIFLSRAPAGVYDVYEPGLGGWTVSPGARWVDDDGHGAPGAVRLAEDPEEGGWARQYVEIGAGRTYTFGYSVRCPSVEIHASQSSSVSFWDENGNLIETRTLPSVCPDAEWTAFSHNVFVPQNAKVIQIQFYERYRGGEPTYIGALYDQVFLEQQATACGNGVLESDEECDDGNLDGGDGCSSQCLTEGCPDGVDNDGDGLTDFAGGDPGCADDSDLSERDPSLACDDGADNDGDGRADFDPITFANPGNATTPPAGSGDPGCYDPSWGKEDPKCQDGIHNDSDGRMDYDAGFSANGSAHPAGRDPQCAGKPWRNRECGLGAELALVLPTLMWMRRRRNRRV